MSGTELILLEKIGTPLLKEGFSRVLRGYAERAENVICSRISRGRLSEIADSKQASALFKYLRLALEGTARVNLDLLAQVIAGRGDADQRTFHLTDFRRWSKVLADLTREEIIVLGRSAILIPQIDAEPNPEGHRAYRLEGRLIKELVGSERPFSNANQLRGTLGALQRFGLFVQVSLYGSTPQNPTPLFDELVRLVNLDEALERYGAQDEAEEKD